ncbi:WRKY transcription factor 71-like [Curcuma longa]|uniref:WRKY transcription factor 71-like n=1 Tax=Curcuma longa TaxID=136217 RepID=UPI003D9DBA30
MSDGKLERGSSSAFEVDDYLAFAEHEAAEVEQHSLAAQGHRDHKISNYKGKNGSSSCNLRRSSSSNSSSFRVAFITKSEKEILDDGYKWRKYGKKAIKSSPNPRNYYRCLGEGCNVKKRVERHQEDPSFVITTYVGVHTHHAPLPSLLL